jgi:uncharacterized protein
MTTQSSTSTTNSAGSSLSGLASLFAAQKLPPVETWNPPFCGDIDMRIARDGTWFYLGTPIGRPAMVKLFASVLRREPDGSFVLVTPVEKVGIKVEDAPFIAVEVFSEGRDKDRTVGFRLNTEEAVLLDEAHGLRVLIDAKTEEPRPYIHVRKGLEALVARSVFYELVEWAYAEKSDDTPLGIWSYGRFFPIDGSGS